jgi:hypothetical protein
MRIEKLRTLWVRLTKRANQASKAAVQTDSRFIPITAGLRVDLSVPTGIGKRTPATDFVWVFPAGPSRSVKTLRVRLLFN